MLRAAHRVADLVSERGPPDVPERPRQPPGHRRPASRKQPAHDPADLPDAAKCRPRLHRTVPEERRRNLHQRGLHRAQAQSLPFADVRLPRCGDRPEVEQGRPERQPQRVVASALRVHDHLSGNARVLPLEPERQLRRQMPPVPEPVAAVTRAELPERRVPRRRVVHRRARVRQHQPTFHDRPQVAVADQPFAMHPRKLP